MGTYKIKDVPPLGYKRSRKWRRSDIAYLLGGILICTSLIFIFTSDQIANAPPDLLGLRAAQSSPFLALVYKLGESFYVLFSAYLCLPGIVIIIIGYFLQRAEKAGLVHVPPKYEKK